MAQVAIFIALLAHLQPALASFYSHIVLCDHHDGVPIHLDDVYLALPYLHLHLPHNSRPQTNCHAHRVAHLVPHPNLHLR